MSGTRLLPSSTGAFIMAFSIAHAMDDGERDTDRLVDIAVRAFEETSIHERGS
jgi:hypothetical protein